MKNTLFIVLLVAVSSLVQAQNRYDDRFRRDNNRNSQENTKSRWENDDDRNRYNNRAYDNSNSYNNRSYDNSYNNRAYDNNYNSYHNNNSLRQRLEYMRLEDLQVLTRDRLNRGINSGQLTRNEARQLVSDLERIDEHIWRFHKDGRISVHEEEHLREDLLSINDRIRWEATDNDYYNRNNNNQNSRWGRRG